MIPAEVTLQLLAEERAIRSEHRSGLFWALQNHESLFRAIQ